MLFLQLTLEYDMHTASGPFQRIIFLLEHSQNIGNEFKTFPYNRKKGITQFEA